METVETVQLHEPMQEAITEVIYHCHICMEAFVCENVFRMHMDNHTAERPFECKICGVRFIDEVHLKKHSDLKHAKGDVYEACPTCGKLFHDKINLKSHMAVHSEDRPFHCGMCGKSFKRKGELESHSIIHTGVKPHKCTLCNRSFTQKYSLKTHMRTHTGEKPFICSICGKEFNRSSSITLHMRQHTGEKPYQCSECNECFKLSRDLNKHMVRAHGKEEKKPRFRPVAMKRGRKPGAKKKGRYECAICRMQFDFVTVFNDHIKTHDVDLCYLCGQKLKNKAEKRRHVTRPIKLKKSECYTCGLKFDKLVDFKAHMNGHSELCRLEECLRNAENLHGISKKPRSGKLSKKGIDDNSEEEDGDLEEFSDSVDCNGVSDADADASPKQMEKNKSSNLHKRIGTNLFTVKQEHITIGDEPETTILELVEGGEGFQLKTHNVMSSPMKFQLSDSGDVSPLSTTTVSDAGKVRRGKRSRYKAARVSPPRTRGSLKVHFKSPIKEEEDTLPLSIADENGISGEDSSNGDEDDSDENDLAETYSTYVKNLLRLQPVKKQMALIKSINKTIGQFIND